MKKLFFPAVIVLSLMACNSDEPMTLHDTSADNQIVETLRTEDEAIKIANKALSENCYNFTINTK